MIAQEIIALAREQADAHQAENRLAAAAALWALVDEVEKSVRIDLTRRLLNLSPSLEALASWIDDDTLREVVEHLEELER
jgi:hypothetical protein